MPFNPFQALRPPHYSNQTIPRTQTLPLPPAPFFSEVEPNSVNLSDPFSRLGLHVVSLVKFKWTKEKANLELIFDNLKIQSLQKL